MLNGGHIKKPQQDKDAYSITRSDSLIVNIDCCDVIDTCCDNCDA